MNSKKSVQAKQSAPRGTRRFRRARPLVVAIAGGSGSGKSWLADLICRDLGPKAARVNLDWFYRDRSHLSASRRARINFDHPRALEWVELEQALMGLVAGRAVTVPGYDFAAHSRTKGTVIRPAPVIVVDGLWTLRRRAVAALVDIAVFMDCPGKIRLQRRLARDTSQRGRSTASVRKQFLNTVEPMHKRFVESQRARATMLVRPGESETAAREIVRRAIAAF